MRAFVRSLHSEVCNVIAHVSVHCFSLRHFLDIVQKTIRLFISRLFITYLSLSLLFFFVCPHSVVTTLAGSGTVALADGNGTSASFGYPLFVAADTVGNVYVTDGQNNVIRMITPTGSTSGSCVWRHFSRHDPFPLLQSEHDERGGA
jgi:hypothetical protein